MAPPQRAGAAAATCARRDRPRAFDPPPRALSFARRRRQHAGGLSDHAGAVLPRAAASGAAPVAEAADRDDAEEPAAASAIGVVLRRPEPGPLPDSDRRSREPARAAVHRQD